jgi:myo-inositol 2-dehydrogenase / D-chiro-inositol 1-dehydrogenase
MTVSVGVIGAGLMGCTHVRTLTRAVLAAEVGAVSDVVGESAERLAREVGVETVYADALELINAPAIDAVVIASPADTHEQFVLACLQAGKPVLCEKPLAATGSAGHRDRRGCPGGCIPRADP